MSSITVSFELQPDPDYRYKVECAGEVVSLMYADTASASADIISFSSIEEMETVARLMLAATKAWKDGYLSN